MKQLTINNMMSNLDNLISRHQPEHLLFDFAPMAFNLELKPWRGNLDDIAIIIDWETRGKASNTTPSQLLEMLKEVHDSVMTTYKGDEANITNDSKVWLVFREYVEGYTGISGLLVGYGNSLIIETNYQDVGL